MLWEFGPGSYSTYGTTPQPYDSGILLTTSESHDPFWGYQSARLDSLPAYAPGDILQWAMLVEVLTPPVGIRFSVQDGRGDENALSILPRPTAGTPTEAYFLKLPDKKAWVITEPVTVSVYKRNIYFFMDSPNKQVVFYRLLLGDPVSIESAIPKEAQPTGFPWVILAGITVTGALLAAVSKKLR